MERLHPRVRLLWIGRAVFAAVVVGLLVAAVDSFFRPVASVWIVFPPVLFSVLGAAHALALYRSWRFELQDDALYLVRGVVTLTDTAVPYVRVQHVDTQRGPVERSVGLASVVVYTAGSRGADITIPGLRPSRADDLRERLRELAVESEPEDAV
ncbi:MAG: PH domain-containing protein [Haloarculaceae archaeon]